MSFTWPWPAAWRRQLGDGDQLALITSVASHYAAAGDQPAALRSTVRAASAADRAMAYGEAAQLAERALELWPRVTDPEALVGCDHVDLLYRASYGALVLGRALAG